MPGLTYGSTGVDYGTLDAFKRACQRQAAETAAALAAHGLKEPPGIRGESAYLIETPDEFLAHVEEGLGTKNLVADKLAAESGARGGGNFYESIGIDTVATIVNDLITTGALPLSIAMHAAVGDSQWFADAERAEALARGFAIGCRRAGAAWGGGETPALKDLIQPNAIVLAGSAIGRIRPKNLRIVGDLADGDAIVLLASSGVHTNGLTLCRAVADRMPKGYLTPLSDGRPYGEALLAPSVIYVPFVAACQAAGVRLKYAAHITGHGWRKLMRLTEPFVYEMTDIGQVPEIFRFLQKAGPIDDHEAYATFNMGAGFAAYVAPTDVPACLAAAGKSRINAWLGGTVRREGTRRAVEILPLGLRFEGQSLQVR